MKKIGLAILLGGLVGLSSSTTLMASTTGSLIRDVEYIGEEDKFWEEGDWEAPELKITISDAYEKAGKTETIIITLENAMYTSGLGSSVTDTEYVDLNHITTAFLNEFSTQYEVDIPTGIRQGECVSFTIPLYVKLLEGDEIWIHIKEKDGDDFKEVQKVLVAAKANKKLSCKVGTVPKINGEGIAAVLTLTEIRDNALDKDDICYVTLKLDSQGYKFGEFKYEEKIVYQDETEYKVKTEEYIKYNDACTNIPKLVRIKTPNKSDQEVTFVIESGQAKDLKEQIQISNIPIVKCHDRDLEEDVKVKLSCENLVQDNEIVVLAKSVVVTKEEKEEEIQQPTNAGIQFKVDTNYYIIDGEKYEMDGSTFVQTPGYIMIPIRYITEALGVYESDITYRNGIVSILYGDKRIELEVNHSKAYINHVAFEMGTAPIIKDGRVYVPAGEIARLLGIKREWNENEKVVVFSK